MILEQVDNPSDLNKLNISQLEQLASEVRDELLSTVSNTGGHLASNLGAVELTISILYTFDFPNDKIVWDVGHQCYTYKLLTGRRDSFFSLRQENGISGFPRSYESKYDFFISGHASTSIAAAYGIKCSMTLQNDPHSVIAVIGDGALTGGLAYEGINNAGKSKENLIVILNDNEMAISKNEGAIARYLSAIRTKPLYFETKYITKSILNRIPIVGKILYNCISKVKSALKKIIYPATFFEEFGFEYLGPVDGHSIKSLCNVLTEAKRLNRPVFVHVNTVKGKGYSCAEKQPENYHGVGRFNIQTGMLPNPEKTGFSEVFGCTLKDMALKDERICAVTAAMDQGTGLTAFAEMYRNKGRYFDVGIAEEFGVTFSAAMASGGTVPVFAVYSTFLQRGYDQIIHDAAIEKRHFILAVDRAGIVGEDGETHHGIFDAAFLSAIPNMTVMAPSNYNELRDMLQKSIAYDGPVAIRYPRGNQDEVLCTYPSTGHSFDLYEEIPQKILLVTYGRTFASAVSALKNTCCGFSILKLNQIAPIDKAAIAAASRYQIVVFVEEGIATGGIGMQFIAGLSLTGYTGKTVLQAINSFVLQGSVEVLLGQLGLDVAGISRLIDGENDEKTS